MARLVRLLPLVLVACGGPEEPVTSSPSAIDAAACFACNDTGDAARTTCEAAFEACRGGAPDLGAFTTCFSERAECRSAGLQAEGACRGDACGDPIAENTMACFAACWDETGACETGALARLEACIHEGSSDCEAQVNLQLQDCLDAHNGVCLPPCAPS